LKTCCVTWVVAALLVAVGAAARGAELGVWAAPEGCKIDKFGKKIFVLDPRQNLEEIKTKNRIWNRTAKTIRLTGARGETACFQLGIEGGEGGLARVDVKPTALRSARHELPADTIRLFKVYYTQITDRGSGPTNSPTMGQGWYPDALVPWSVGDTDAYGGYDGPPFAVKPGEIQGVWLDLAIPYGTPAGEYVGALTVTAEGAETALSLVVRVRDFDIPRKLHNLFFINFSVDDLSQAGGYWLKGDKLTRYEDEVYRGARAHRFTASNMYNAELPTVDETPDGQIRRVDWSRYDAHFDKVLSPKQNLFGPGEEPIEIWKLPLGPGIRSLKCPKSDKAWEPMIAEIKKHWQEKLWDLSRAYVYLADEPDKEFANKLNELARRIKESPGPNLHRQIAVYTILGRDWDKQQWVFDLWKDNLDMWMVAGDYYNVKRMDALPRGTLKGMYQGAEPFQGNETLDADGIAFRTWSWVAWQYRLDYECYYSMGGGHHRAEPVPGSPNKFREVKKRSFDCDIWDYPRNRTWAVSQAVFIYPGKKVGLDLPIWNIRTKQIRRGQTDFEYFWLLRQAGQEALADSLCRGVLNVALSEAASRAEAYGAGKWSHNPDDWDAAVEKAGDKLEELRAKLPKEPAAPASAK
jgi:hypothetical protein